MIREFDFQELDSEDIDLMVLRTSDNKNVTAQATDGFPPKTENGVVSVYLGSGLPIGKYLLVLKVRSKGAMVKTSCPLTVSDFFPGKL